MGVFIIDSLFWVISEVALSLRHKSSDCEVLRNEMAILK